MGDNVIKLAARSRRFATHSASSVDDDSFLVEEGLDLLAAYRSIPNREVRLSLKRLIKSTARIARFRDPPG